MTVSTPLPPLPPPRLADVAPPRRSRLPVLIGAAGLAAAAVMTMLWLSARDANSNATVERDSAIVERDSAIAASLDAEAERRTMSDELADQREELDRVRRAPAESDGATSDEVLALNERAAELETEVELLEAENRALADDLVAAQADADAARDASQAADGGNGSSSDDAADAETDADGDADAGREAGQEVGGDAGDDAGVDAVDPPAATTDDSAPPAPAPADLPEVTASDVGDEISGLFRRSVLGPIQEECLGQVVLDDLGAQRVLEALATDSPGDDDEFVVAIENATAACGIDPSAVFG